MKVTVYNPHGKYDTVAMPLEITYPRLLCAVELEDGNGTDIPSTLLVGIHYDAGENMFTFGYWDDSLGEQTWHGITHVSFNKIHVQYGEV